MKLHSPCFSLSLSLAGYQCEFTMPSKNGKTVEGFSFPSIVRIHHLKHRRNDFFFYCFFCLVVRKVEFSKPHTTIIVVTRQFIRRWSQLNSKRATKTNFNAKWCRFRGFYSMEGPASLLDYLSRDTFCGKLQWLPYSACQSSSSSRV